MTKRRIYAVQRQLKISIYCVQSALPINVTSLIQSKYRYIFGHILLALCLLEKYILAYLAAALWGCIFVNQNSAIDPRINILKIKGNQIKKCDLIHI